MAWMLIGILVTAASGSAFTIQTTASDANATLPSNANLLSGTLTASVTLKTAGTSTITATDVDDGTKTASTSPAVTVNAGAFAKLQILALGETPAPGTAWLAKPERPLPRFPGPHSM